MLHFFTTFLVLRDVFTSMQPFVVVFNAVIGSVVTIITLYLLIRTRPRKIKAEILKPGAVIVNFSGHPLPEAPWAVPFQKWEPGSAPHFNVDSWKTIQESVQRMLYSLPQDLQLRLLRGDVDVVIVIPQLAAGVSVFLATLHGQTGVFPTITCPLRNKDGSFSLPEPINLSDIRLCSRKERPLGEL